MICTRSEAKPPLPHRTALRWCAVLAILAAAGCDPDPTSIPTGAAGGTVPTVIAARAVGAPDQPPATIPGFYPLEMGNHWEYQGLLHVRVLDDDGNVLEDLSFPSEFTRVVTGTEELFGREYVLEEESGVQHSPLGGGPTTWTYWYRYRQDGSGLYEADVSLVDPPGVHPVPGRVPGGSKPGIALPLGSVPEGHRGAFRAALQRLEARRTRLRAALGQAARGSGGALDHELTRLRYPLHPGAAWEIRDDPELVIHARVERHEVLELPAGRFPAWRIRIRWELGDADDTILVWYGSSGYLQSFVHIRSDAIDPDGTPIGVVVSDETEVLASLELAGQPVRRGPRPDVASK